MAYPSRPRPLVVAILDGWGVSFLQEGNAIAQAPTPNMDMFTKYYPMASIQAGGIEVGLPWGEIGNSETGHRNIGAGQVQYQELPMIDKTISDGTFFQNAVLKEAIERAKRYNSALHLMGLVSPGGVHAHMDHLFALLAMCKKMDFKEKVYIHMFTDGRDTPPQSALTYLTKLEDEIGRQGVGRIASVTGRFYAMDRNGNWDRTKALYDMLLGGERMSGAPTAREAIEQSYNQNIFDEMIPPTAITRGGSPIAPIKDYDSVIFFNFRPDRARQLTQTFVQPYRTGFSPTLLPHVYFCTMYKYDVNIPAPAAFEAEKGEAPMAKVISDNGLTQLHIAETEKYAHITYYLNVGHEEPFPGEEHVLIESSRVSNFADVPEMGAEAITNRVLDDIESGLYDVYFINFANADMVGHTGNFDAALRACAFVDTCLGRIHEALKTPQGAMLITADHGNAEEMRHPETGKTETDHTGNSVPLYYVNDTLKRATPKGDGEILEILSTPIGVLADIAPTVLDILGIQKPPVMTGVSLLNSLR